MSLKKKKKKKNINCNSSNSIILVHTMLLATQHLGQIDFHVLKMLKS